MKSSRDKSFDENSMKRQGIKEERHKLIHRTANCVIFADYEN